MKLQILLTILLFNAVPEMALAQNDSTKVPDRVEDLRFYASKGFDAYGFGGYGFRDESFVTVLSLEMKMKSNHGLFAEYVYQPMMQYYHYGYESDELVSFFLPANSIYSSDFYFDVYARSNAFQVGYFYTWSLRYHIDVLAKLGYGRVFMDYKGYVSYPENLSVDEYYAKETLNVFQAGVKINYWASKHFGLSAEGSVALNAPLLKLGLAYKIPVK